MGKRLNWKWLLGALTVWLVLIIVTARPADRRLFPESGGNVAVYVINNGFHTDIALPAKAVMARGGLLSRAGKAAGQGNWLVIGWGDAGFYTESGFSTARVIDGGRALFWPNNPSVIRVFAINAKPDKAFIDTEVLRADLSSDGFEALARRIETSFRQQNGEPVGVNVNADAVFFSSSEHFSAVRTCNRWTADQLAAAGLPTTPMIDGIAPLLALDLKLRAGLKP